MASKRTPYKLQTYEQFVASAETDLIVPNDVPPYPIDNAERMQTMYANYRQSGFHHATFLYFTRSAYLQEYRLFHRAELCEEAAPC